MKAAVAPSIRTSREARCTQNNGPADTKYGGPRRTSSGSRNRTRSCVAGTASTASRSTGSTASSATSRGVTLREWPVQQSTKASQAGTSAPRPTYFRSPQWMLWAGPDSSSAAEARFHTISASRTALRARPAPPWRRDQTKSARTRSARAQAPIPSAAASTPRTVSPSCGTGRATGEISDRAAADLSAVRNTTNSRRRRLPGSAKRHFPPAPSRTQPAPQPPPRRGVPGCVVLSLRPGCVPLLGCMHPAVEQGVAGPAGALGRELAQQGPGDHAVVEVAEDLLDRLGRGGQPGGLGPERRLHRLHGVAQPLGGLAHLVQVLVAVWPRLGLLCGPHPAAQALPLRVDAWAQHVVGRAQRHRVPRRPAHQLVEGVEQPEV